ncbi:MAG: autotransporter domain-containing protein [Neorhizobium sp.]|nr:autotransporter domain-containing protein [Neorhizobium sp.]
MTLILSSPASAQSVWTGAGNNDFSDGANWSTAPAAPGAADQASVSSGTAIESGPFVVNSLDVSGGTLRVEGDLSAPGGTTVSATGRVEVSTGGTLASDATVTGGYLGISGTLDGDVTASGGSVINDGTVTGTASVDGATLTNNGALSGLAITSGGTVINNGGATVTGSSTVSDGTLNNNGTLSDATIGSSGILTNNSGASVGALTNAGTVSNAGTIASLTNTAGSFVNNDGGTVTGTTTVSGGSVTNNFVVNAVDVMAAAMFSNNSGATAGAVTNAGSSSNAGTIASLTNTAGSFVNNDGGTVTGTTTVSGGSVTNNFVVNAVDVTAAAMFANNTGATAGDVANAGNTTNAGTIASLDNTAGTFINNAGGTVTGGTTVSGGSVTNNATLGDVSVTSGGTFVNNSGAIAGAVENAGTASNDGTIASLTNTGGTFSNSGTITGDATVTGGTLVNDGSIGGTLSIYTGGLLTGSGDVGTLTVASGGTLAPGSGYATVTVNGNLTFETGSTYEVETEASGASGSVAATGSVTIRNGSTLSILAGNGTYGLSTSYMILTGSSIVGEFDTVTTDLAFLSPILTYDPTGVTLGLYRNDVDFADVATTANGRATANAVQALGTDNTLFLGVLPLSASGARDAFAQLSGESHVSMKSMLIENSDLLRDAILDRFSGTGSVTVEGGNGTSAVQATKTADDGPSFWMAGLGASTRISGDGNAAGIDGGTGGLVIGADNETVGGWHLGGALGYSHTSSSGEADADSYHAALYASNSWGPFSFTGGALYSKSEIETDRSLSFGTFSDRLKANYDSATRQAFADISWGFKADKLELRPFADVAYVSLDTDGFAENGGAAALSARSGTDNLTFTTIGVRWSTEVQADEIPVMLSGMAGWRHAVGDVTPATTFSYAGGSPFMIEGVAVPRDTAVIEASIAAPLSKTARLKLTYTGEFGNGAESHAARLSLVARF